MRCTAARGASPDGSCDERADGGRAALVAVTETRGDGLAPWTLRWSAAAPGGGSWLRPPCYNDTSAMADLADRYDPRGVESRWYAEWEAAATSRPSPTHTGRPYCIVIPPPNVTGSLHMGHALDNTLQDVLIRYKRMDGYNALWVPGTDHAGIATQYVMERQLAAEGKTKHDIGRAAFLARMWQWKAESRGTIISQLKRLGASCDWRRERFTMDEGLSRAVREAFVRLHEEGLIYQDDYIVNWCPRCQTVLSDLEVEREERDARVRLHQVRAAHPRHGAAGDQARRHRPGRAPEGQALREVRGPDARHPLGAGDDPRAAWWPTPRSTRSSAPASSR